MKLLRLLENFSDLYSYSFWKFCHPEACAVIPDWTFIRDIWVIGLHKCKILWVQQNQIEKKKSGSYFNKLQRSNLICCFILIIPEIIFFWLAQIYSYC